MTTKWISCWYIYLDNTLAIIQGVDLKFLGMERGPGFPSGVVFTVPAIMDDSAKGDSTSPGKVVQGSQ